LVFSKNKSFNEVLSSIVYDRGKIFDGGSKFKVYPHDGLKIEDSFSKKHVEFQMVKESPDF
jgi:hypothetical protein